MKCFIISIIILTIISCEEVNNQKVEFSFYNIDQKNLINELNFTIHTDVTYYHSHIVIIDVSKLKDLNSAFHFNLISEHAECITYDIYDFDDIKIEDIIENVKKNIENSIGFLKPNLYPNTRKIAYLKIKKIYDSNKYLAIGFSSHATSDPNNRDFNVTMREILPPEKIGSDYSYYFKEVSHIFQINTTQIKRDYKMVILSTEKFIVFDEQKLAHNNPEIKGKIYLYAFVRVPIENKNLYILVNGPPRKDVVFKVKFIDTKDIKLHFYDYNNAGMKNAFQVYINDCKKPHYFFGKIQKDLENYLLFPDVEFGEVKLKVVNDMKKIVENFGTYNKLPGKKFLQAIQLKEREMLILLTCKSPSLITIRNMLKRNYRLSVKKSETHLIYLESHNSYFPEVEEDNTEIKLKLLNPYTPVKVEYYKNKISKYITNENRLNDTYRIIDTLNKNDKVKVQNKDDNLFVWTVLISATDKEKYNIIQKEMEGYASNDKPYYFFMIPNNVDFKEFHIFLTTENEKPKKIFHYMGFGKMPFIYSPDNYINYKVLSKSSPVIINIQNPYKFIRSNPTMKHFYVSLSGMNSNDIYIQHYYDKKLFLSEDEDLISVKMQNITLTKNKINSNILLQFDNCENKKIEFELELNGEKNYYSFDEKVKYYYFPIKNDNLSPKIYFLNTNERMLRYYYSDEKVFSFNPIQDRTIKVKRTKFYFVFEFQNLIKNENFEYIFLLFKNYDKSKLNDLRNRCFIEKVLNGLTKLDYIRKSLITQDIDTGKMTYEYRVPKNVRMTNFAFVVISKHTKKFKIESIYEPNYYDGDGFYKENSLIKVSSFILFFIFIAFIIVSKMNLKKKNSKFSNKYFEMSDEDIYVY